MDIFILLLVMMIRKISFIFFGDWDRMCCDVVFFFWVIILSRLFVIICVRKVMKLS